MCVSRISSKGIEQSGFLSGSWGASCVGVSFLCLQTLGFWGNTVRSSPPSLLPASRWLPLSGGRKCLISCRKPLSAAKCSVCLICDRPASKRIIRQSESPGDWHHPLERALRGSKAETCAAAVLCCISWTFPDAAWAVKVKKFSLHKGCRMFETSWTFLFVCFLKARVRIQTWQLVLPSSRSGTNAPGLCNLLRLWECFGFLYSTHRLLHSGFLITTNHVLVCVRCFWCIDCF